MSRYTDELEQEAFDLAAKSRAQTNRINALKTRIERLEAALRTVEAHLCDKPLCGHFTAEEIREVVRAALEDKS